MPVSVNRVKNIKKENPWISPVSKSTGRRRRCSLDRGAIVVIVVGSAARAPPDPRETAAAWGRAATREAAAAHGEGRIWEQGARSGPRPLDPPAAAVI
jgi:hypothetical protein